MKIKLTLGWTLGTHPPLVCDAERQEGWRVCVYDQSTNTLLANKVLTIELDKMERGQTAHISAVHAGGLYNRRGDDGDFWIGVGDKSSIMMKVSKPTAANLARVKPKGRRSLISQGGWWNLNPITRRAIPKTTVRQRRQRLPSDETGTSESDARRALESTRRNNAGARSRRRSRRRPRRASGRRVKGCRPSGASEASKPEEKPKVDDATSLD